MVKDNKLIGRVQLNNIMLGPRSVPPIEVTFDLDASFALTVMVVDKSSGRRTSKTFGK